MIVIVAGNRKEVDYWIKNNIIPVTCEEDERKLLGRQIDKVYYEGSYSNWITSRMFDILRIVSKKETP